MPKPTWLIILITWTVFIAAVTYVGVGFAGGVSAAFDGNPLAWLMAASPLVPLFFWWRAKPVLSDD